MKILLIEDNEEIANGLSYTFKENNYEFYHVNSLYKAKNIINKIDFNLIILDVTLSDGNGFDFYKENLNLKDIPVIFLTAKDSEDDIVKGFELGCDDYITKPFMTRELLARVARLLSNKKNVINVKDITFDSDKMEVKKNGDIINLTSLELKILYLFNIISLIFSIFSSTLEYSPIVSIKFCNTFKPFIFSLILLNFVIFL